jgi:ABC-type antimicrobial peptide transport system permease subunit
VPWIVSLDIFVKLIVAFFFEIGNISFVFSVISLTLQVLAHIIGNPSIIFDLVVAFVRSVTQKHFVYVIGLCVVPKFIRRILGFLYRVERFHTTPVAG